MLQTVLPLTLRVLKEAKVALSNEFNPCGMDTFTSRRDPVQLSAIRWSIRRHDRLKRPQQYARIRRDAKNQETPSTGGAVKFLVPQA